MYVFWETEVLVSSFRTSHEYPFVGSTKVSRETRRGFVKCGIFATVFFFLTFVTLNYDDSREISRYKYGTPCRGTRVEVPPPTRTQLSNTLHLLRSTARRAGAGDRLWRDQGATLHVAGGALGSQDDDLR